MQDAPVSKTPDRLVVACSCTLLHSGSVVWRSIVSVTENQPTHVAIEDAIARTVAAVASLPLDQRKVLTVAIASDLTYDEIAGQGGFAPETVLGWMREGLHAISSALDANGEPGTGSA